MEQSKSKSVYFLLFIAICAVASAGYFFYVNINLEKDIQTLTTERDYLQTVNSSSTQMLAMSNNTITELNGLLALTKEELDEMENDYRDERRKNDDFEDEYRSVLNTVKDLDKLSKTDKELLQKYSKVYFLNENFIPSKLRAIDDKYTLASRQQQYFHGNALPFLEKMLDKAKSDDIDLKVISAYRSFDQQTSLKGNYTQTYGTGANAFSADQGYSEHQLGTTLDISDSVTNGPYLAFENTASYQWLQKNAYKYGFVLSYPKDNGFYMFEPWHWRFVGEELAAYIHKNDTSFYSMEQRKIDAFLLNIFD